MYYCGYTLPFPDETIHCSAYSYAKYPNGISYCHYPMCDDEHCPIKHPELLNGGVLKVDKNDVYIYD